MLPAHRNPFRTSRLEGLRFHFPPGWDMARLLGRLEALGGRGVIVGPPGSGKTTLLAELGRALERQGLRILRLRVGHPGDPSIASSLSAISASAREGAILVDTGRTLDTFSRWRLVRAARRCRFLVLTAHRPGGLPTLIRLAVTPVLLGGLLAELDPGRACQMPEDLEELLSRHDHDLHRVFLELYDTAAE
jgi:hypothetical protein